jgi:hypothetical protein
MRFGLVALPLLAMSVDHVEAATKKSTAAIPPLSCRLFHQADVANLCTQAGLSAAVTCKPAFSLLRGLAGRLRPRTLRSEGCQQVRSC